VPEGWQINGQKLWGTGNHVSDYILVAARTDPDAAKPRNGISLFLIESDVPGLAYQEHRSLAGEVSCTTFWDDVVVPDSALLGTVNEGWQQLTYALAGERIIIGASVARVLRNLNELIAIIREAPDSYHAGRHSFVREQIAKLATRVQLGRVLMANSVRTAGSDTSSFLQAPMAKIVSAELAEEFGELALQILGPMGTLQGETKTGIRHDGRFEQSLRAAVSHVIFGGTNDIQRNLVARGIGLPR
jgi:alkylation response protein AidB-like acyl-CoA dehydrogenase